MISILTKDFTVPLTFHCLILGSHCSSTESEADRRVEDPGTLFEDNEGTRNMDIDLAPSTIGEGEKKSSQPGNAEDGVDRMDTDE